jgi:hypothetical protein
LASPTAADDAHTVLTDAGGDMHSFYLHVKRHGQWIHYPEQDGRSALAMMEFLLERGVESKAVAKINGHSEIFNINELREAIEAVEAFT